MDISSYLTPGQIQMDLTMLCSIAGGMLSASTKKIINTVADDIVQLGDGKITIKAVDDLVAASKVSVPTEELPLYNLVVNSVVAIVNLVVVKFGSHNVVLMQYIDAIATPLATLA